VLDLVTEAKLLRRFRPPGRDLRALYAGYYVAELLAELTHDDDPHPELFDLAERTLADLSAGGPVTRITLRFELQALRILGHLPSLSVCAACGSPVRFERRVAFGLLDGGVLCQRCRSGKTQVASIRVEALRTMSELADPATLGRDPAQPDRGTGGELRGLLNRYLANLLGHQPRMHRYLGLPAE
jgi:DNA repair protein RecO (recombination protein O)